MGFYLKSLPTSSQRAKIGRAETALGSIEIECVDFLCAGISREQRGTVGSEAAPSANGIAEEGSHPPQAEERVRVGSTYFDPAKRGLGANFIKVEVLAVLRPGRKANIRFLFDWLGPFMGLKIEKQNFQ